MHEDLLSHLFVCGKNRKSHDLQTRTLKDSSSPHLHGGAEKIENSGSNEQSQQVWKNCKCIGLYVSVGQGALSGRLGR